MLEMASARKAKSRRPASRDPTGGERGWGVFAGRDRFSRAKSMNVTSRGASLARWLLVWPGLGFSRIPRQSHARGGKLCNPSTVPRLCSHVACVVSACLSSDEMDAMMLCTHAARGFVSVAEPLPPSPFPPALPQKTRAVMYACMHVYMYACTDGIVRVWSWPAAVPSVYSWGLQQA